MKQQVKIMTLADQSWVLVTGASSGFGEEISRRYAAQGRLVLVARRIEKLQTLATETDVGFFGVCDNHLLDRSQAGDSKDGEDVRVVD